MIKFQHWLLYLHFDGTFKVVQIKNSVVPFLFSLFDFVRNFSEIWFSGQVSQLGSVANRWDLDCREKGQFEVEK